MNTTELRRERKRLIGVLEDAKSARTRVQLIDKLLAYEGAESSNGNGSHAAEMLACPRCGGQYKGKAGLARHTALKHKGSKTGISSAAKARRRPAKARARRRG